MSRTRQCPGRTRSVLFLFGLIFSMPLVSNAQEPFSAAQLADGSIEVIVNRPLIDPADRPIIKMFEVSGTGKAQRTFERTPTGETKGISNNRFIGTVRLPPPRAGFDHYDFEVLNYKTSDGIESFRGSVTLNLSAGIVRPANGNKLRIEFRAPDTFDWQNLARWISTATGSGATVKVTLQNGQSQDYNVTGTSLTSKKCPALRPGESSTLCTVRAVLELDSSLPVGLSVNVAVKLNEDAFSPGPIADGLPLAQFRGGIIGRVGTDQALAAGKDRDPVRANVIEIGGSYSTSIKLDPDPTSTKPPKRKTDGSLDLRLATPTIFFHDEIEKWWTWTPAQLEGQISTGKLTGENLATNTIRAFTQIQRVLTIKRTRDRDWLRFTGEGGASADRDLRTIEYTGSADFRYSPAFLFRTLSDNPLPGRAPTLLVEFMPAGIEIGRRQVRRDPIFLADDFVRRFRFAGKLELQLPPYLQFKIENRSWVRGEVEKSKFRNFFSTSLTIFPAKQSSNSSAGVFLSYERGSLPPFSTARSSTFRFGFRVRRKDW